MIVLKDIQLTKNFKLSEFMCHAGANVDGHDTVMLDMNLATKLQMLRNTLGKPITIAAGYRSPAHNAAVGGSPGSKHMLGEAADIKVVGVHPRTVAAAALSIGFTGIGWYVYNGQSFTHVDVRSGAKSLWHDNPNTKNLTKVTKF